LRFANGLKGQLLIGHGFLPILDTEVPALKKTRKSPSRAVVLKPVRYPNRYRHLLRSTGVTFDFSVSLDYSLTVNPLPDCKLPAINHQFFNDSKPASARLALRAAFDPSQLRGGNLKSSFLKEMKL